MYVGILRTAGITSQLEDTSLGLSHNISVRRLQAPLYINYSDVIRCHSQITSLPPAGAPAHGEVLRSERVDRAFNLADTATNRSLATL